MGPVPSTQHTQHKFDDFNVVILWNVTYEKALLELDIKPILRFLGAETTLFRLSVVVVEDTDSAAAGGFAVGCSLVDGEGTTGESDALSVNNSCRNYEGAFTHVRSHERESRALTSTSVLI